MNYIKMDVYKNSYSLCSNDGDMEEVIGKQMLRSFKNLSKA